MRFGWKMIKLSLSKTLKYLREESIFRINIYGICFLSFNFPAVFTNMRMDLSCAVVIIFFTW